MGILAGAARPFTLFFQDPLGAMPEFTLLLLPGALLEHAQKVGTAARAWIHCLV